MLLLYSSLLVNSTFCLYIYINVGLQGSLAVLALNYFLTHPLCDVVATSVASVCIHRMAANYLEPAPVFQIKNGLLFHC